MLAVGSDENMLRCGESGSESIGVRQVVLGLQARSPLGILLTDRNESNRRPVKKLRHAPLRVREANTFNKTVVHLAPIDDRHKSHNADPGSGGKDVGNLFGAGASR